MTTESNSSSHLGEDTLIAIQETLSTKRWSKYQKRSGQPGRSHRLTIAKGQPLIPYGSNVDCLFMLGVGTVRMEPGPGQKHVPIVSRFHGSPTRTPRHAGSQRAPGDSRKLIKDLPVLGARYYFTRRPASFAYIAETDCAVYTIDSDLIVDIGAHADGDGDDNMFLLMRETLINSDIAEHYAQEVLQKLGIQTSRVNDEFALLSASEAIRDYPLGPKIKETVSEIFEGRVKMRIKKAEEQGLDASICMAKD